MGTKANKAVKPTNDTLVTSEITPRPLKDIRADPGNPRKHFDLESILVTLEGDDPCIHEPIRIRPTRASDKNPDGKSAKEPWTIIEGERRWRSAKKKGLTTIKCLPPEELDETSIRCQQVASSATKSTLLPLEQADAIAALQHVGKKLSIADLAKRCGLTPRAVNRALALSAIAPEVRTALDKGDIILPVAEKIASLNDQSAQVELCNRLIKQKDGDKPKQAQWQLDNHFHLSLLASSCGFDPADKKLPGGVCELCPKNTNAQRSLGILDDETTEGQCSDRTCFGQKRLATWEKRKAIAIKAGLAVIEGEKAVELYPAPWSVAPHDESLTDLDQHNIVNGERKSYRELLGDAAKPTVLVYAHEKVHECMPSKAVSNALRATGNASLANDNEDDGDNMASNGGPSGTKPKLPAKTPASRKEAEQREALLMQMLGRIDPVDAENKPSLRLWRFLANLAVRTLYDQWNLDEMRERRGMGQKSLVRGDDLAEMVGWVVDELRTVAELARVVVEYFVSNEADDEIRGMALRYAGLANDPEKPAPVAETPAHAPTKTSKRSPKKKVDA